MIFMLVMFAFFMFQSLMPQTSQAATELIAGVAASFIISFIKRLGENSRIRISGAAAQLLTLALALAIAVGVKYYFGEITSFGDLVKSMGVVAMSAVATYQFLIAKFGLVEPKLIAKAAARRQMRRQSRYEE